MYYFYMGREAALRETSVTNDQAFAETPGQGRALFEKAGAGSGSKPFASRMTYELSQFPEDRPVALKTPVSVTAVSAQVARAPVASTPPPGAGPAAIEPPPAERIVNARPISALPPEPRDRTREIEKEAQKTEYREPARPQTKATPVPMSGRVIEGREVELKPLPKLPDTPARTTVAGLSDKPAAESPKKATEERAPVIAGPLVQGATPIKPPARDSASEPAAVAKAPSTTLVTPGVRPDTSAPSASGDTVESRLEATREWLAAAAPATHTIQLMGANGEEQLRAHLKSLGKVIDPGRLYVFRTKAQGKPSLTVLYGAYADRQSALQALQKLPAAVAANKPALRTVNGIRAEMKQHNTDSK